MKTSLSIPEGHYIVAVSGGVDSVVLLDMLSKLPSISLNVAHFDHGIRKNSKSDRLFVESLARGYGFSFSYTSAKLGPNTSEEFAREARYKFLNQEKKRVKAKAIILGHHQDDQIETAIINLIRGTGRRGLSSLRSDADLLRPLLSTTKKDLIQYAKQHNLVWHEDETNSNTDYLRNYIRHELLPRFTATDKQKLLELSQKSGLVNDEIDSLLNQQLDQQLNEGELSREWFIMLPHDLAKETIASWFRQNGLAGFDRKTIDRAVVAAKTYRANTQVDIYNGYALAIGRRKLALSRPDR